MKTNKRPLLNVKSILILIVIIFIVIISSKKTVENYRLKRNGIITKAIIVNKKNVGSKGVIYTYYEYKVNGIKYSAYSSSDDNVAVGDSIDIIYLKSDPEVSRSNSFLKNKEK
jgi:hypothetical protein